MTNYDSEFCGNLPIHQINQIQAYGVLLVIHAERFEILQASENAIDIFNISLKSLVNSSLEQYLSPEAIHSLKAKSIDELREPIPVSWKIKGRSYLTLIHRKKNILLAEIDALPYDEGNELSFVEVYQPIKVGMAMIAKATTLGEVVSLAAKELKRISGFDKVMIYRFDGDWNGNVIAEEARPDMESYMGFTFPASDIPRQARDLYLRNPYRFIPTREYKPIKLYPVINPETQSFVDLSDCNLRSVAQVHLEYLKNMNVDASMSTRILVEDKLWGLIACHHMTPKMIPYEMRSVFEMLSSIISQKIAALEHRELHEFKSRLKDQYNKLVEDSYRGRKLGDGLFNGDVDLLDLFRADGAVLSHKGRLQTKGTVPDEERMKELFLWLHTKALKNTYCSDHLASEYDQSKQFRQIASGLMVIPIDYTQDEYVILFRPEVLRTIQWGGNPDERIQFGKDEVTYHPRYSFKLWQQHVEGMSMPWRNEEVNTAEDLRTFIMDFSN